MYKLSLALIVNLHLAFEETLHFEHSNERMVVIYKENNQS